MFFLNVRCTLQGTNIIPYHGNFEDELPFLQVGYVSSMEGILFWLTKLMACAFLLFLSSDQ